MTFYWRIQIDVNYYLEEKPEDHARCELPVNAFDGGPTDDPGVVVFQCHGKKMNFFIMMLIAQIILLGIHYLQKFTLKPKVTNTRCQFHQHLMRAYCANNYHAKM